MASCFQDNLAENGELSYISTEFCGFFRGYGQAALQILNFGNQYGKEGFYSHWLSQYTKGEMENACPDSIEL